MIPITTPISIVKRINVKFDHPDKVFVRINLKRIIAQRVGRIFINAIQSKYSYFHEYRMKNFLIPDKVNSDSFEVAWSKL